MLELKPLQAVIFDLDGVLVSTSRLHAQAWRELAERHGIQPPEDLEERVKGISRMASLRIAVGGRWDALAPAEREAMAEWKNSRYLALCQNLSPQDLFPGAAALLEDLRQSGIRVCLGSASKNSRPILEKLDIAAAFDAVADGFSYRLGKPHPDVFLTAARMAKAPPEACIVVEDATAGITAALDGGFVAVGMGAYESLRHAHAFIRSLADTSAAALQEVHARFHPRLWTVPCDGVYPGRASWTIDGEAVNLKAECLNCQLDLRTGLHTAAAHWVSPHGKELRFVMRRFADRAHPFRTYTQYELEALNFSGHLEVRTGLESASAPTQPLHTVTGAAVVGDRAVAAQVRGERGGEGAAVATGLNVPDHAGLKYEVQAAPNTAGVRTHLHLSQGQLVYVECCEAVVAERRVPDVMAAASGEIREALETGFTAARIASAGAWQTLWDANDIRIDGDPDGQLGARLKIYQQLIALRQHDGGDAYAGSHNVRLPDGG
jgi:beta-phosphoglucomutase